MAPRPGHSNFQTYEARSFVLKNLAESASVSRHDSGRRLFFGTTTMDSSARHQRLTDIYLEACDLQGEERISYLDQACGDDLSLREEVEAMLATHSESDTGLDGLLESTELCCGVWSLRTPCTPPKKSHLRDSNP